MNKNLKKKNCELRFAGTKKKFKQYVLDRFKIMVTNNVMA